MAEYLLLAVSSPFFGIHGSGLLPKCSGTTQFEALMWMTGTQILEQPSAASRYTC